MRRMESNWIIRSLLACMLVVVLTATGSAQERERLEPIVLAQVNSNLYHASPAQGICGDCSTQAVIASSTTATPAPVITYRVVAPPNLTYVPWRGRAYAGGSWTSYRPVLVQAPVRAKTWVVGRGVLGQPKVYVTGQPLRNVVRFLSP